MSQWTENPVCNVMIVDSVVVNKNDVLSHLRLPGHIGHLYVDNEYHEVTFENEFTDQRMFAMADTSGHHNIYRQTLLGSKWSTPELVNINGEFTDIRNPFPMPDGQTLFFAAKSDDDNEGNTYSLYTTTFDSETNSYLTPQRLPYPFTSDEDDLWYIEDETDSLAWFVSSRRQPEGMVCIYTMRVHEPWVFYDSEETDPYQLKRFALINSISDTWPSQMVRNQAYAEITAIFDDYDSASNAGHQILFVVNDRKVITSTSDFVTERARQLFAELTTVRSKITSLTHQLEEYRRMYHYGSADNQNRLTEVIRDAEQQLASAFKSEASLSNNIRKIEQQY